MLAETHLWSYWLAVPLALMSVLVVVGILVLYVVRVTRTRYPQK